MNRILPNKSMTALFQYNWAAVGWTLTNTNMCSSSLLKPTIEVQPCKAYNCINKRRSRKWKVKGNFEISKAILLYHLLLTIIRSVKMRKKYRSTISLV